MRRAVGVCCVGIRCRRRGACGAMGPRVAAPDVRAGGESQAAWRLRARDRVLRRSRIRRLGCGGDGDGPAAARAARARVRVVPRREDAQARARGQLVGRLRWHCGERLCAHAGSLSRGQRCVHRHRSDALDRVRPAVVLPRAPRPVPRVGCRVLERCGCMPLRLELGAAGRVRHGVGGGRQPLAAPRLHLGDGGIGPAVDLGRCRVFDASADGQARSEACAAVVLRPRADGHQGAAPRLLGGAVVQRVSGRACSPPTARRSG